MKIPGRSPFEHLAEKAVISLKALNGFPPLKGRHINVVMFNVCDMSGL